MSDFNVLKEYYIRYLKQVRGNSDSSVNHYIGALQTISKYLVERGKIANTIYEIDNVGDAIRERISGKRARAAKAPRADRGGVSLLIDIQNSIKAQESRGYEQWAKIHNLKQAAKTMNFLTEHKIEQYAELTAKITEVTKANEQLERG